jgi:hypothetical protein
MIEMVYGVAFGGAENNLVLIDGILKMSVMLCGLN